MISGADSSLLGPNLGALLTWALDPWKDSTVPLGDWELELYLMQEFHTFPDPRLQVEGVWLRRGQVLPGGLERAAPAEGEGSFWGPSHLFPRPTLPTSPPPLWNAKCKSWWGVWVLITGL